MDLGIAGKRALVLGGSRGLGLASARALAAEGVEVTIASRSAKSMEGLDAIPVDLGEEASLEALLAAVLEKGPVDILVNNAGGPRPGPVRDQTRESWAGAFNALALPVFSITAALIAPMIERGWGRIITIGSSGMVQPVPNLVLSNGARGAVAGWSKTLAAEVASTGVTVNIVMPGRIDTDRVREIDAARAAASGRPLADIQAESRADIPAGRYGEPAEFGAAVAFLASRQASYVTGSLIAVDGGMIRGL